jgi:HSP20 family molecular chaperone IbpA
MSSIYLGNEILNSFFRDLTESNCYRNYDQLFSNNCNLVKEEERYVYSTIATGLSEEDLEINVDNNFLVVKSKGERKSNLVTCINQKVKLQTSVDHENITANLDKGILTLYVHFKAQKEDSTSVKFI